MVVLPLLASFWFASNAVRTARADSLESARVLREQRTRDFSEKIAARMRELERALSADLDKTSGAAVSKKEASQWAASSLNAERFILQRFQFAATGELVSPDVTRDSGPRFNAFMLATDSLRRDGLVLGKKQNENGSQTAAGWHGWYHDEGWQLIYWKRRTNDVIDGAWINRPVLISDIIGQLPDTSLASEQRTRTGSADILFKQSYGDQDIYQLLGASEMALYQWGDLSTDKPSANVQIPLADPLSAWALRCRYLPPTNPSLWAQRGALMIIFGTALFLALSYFFLREHRRKLREAQDRVSFVNQVSHELKTPLTNIQLYSELAATKLDGIEGAEPAQGKLAVIKHETARLGRLIHNVLTFARDEKGTLTVNPKIIEIDPLVDEVIESWRPSLENAGIAIERTGSASQCRADSDAIEQVIGNLISNVEKYAADGKWIGIETSETSEHVVVRVADHGPGIPANQRHAIFNAFVRIDDRVNAKAAGSGLGLSIARRLIEHQGGEITCRAGSQGSIFEFTLPKAQS